MTRKNKMLLNSASSLMFQFISIICGFILPRMFLITYGSAVNGLISSIAQFLGFISLCEMGVGAVVQSSLYRPLADNDIISISKITISSERFFRKIAYILLAYTMILMVLYPFKTIDNFDYMYTMLLVLVISISTFAQYYFGMTYRLVLTADQLGFVHYIVHSLSLILNTVACIILMKIGATIHIVKLTTSLIFLLQPICISLVAKHRYQIDRRIVLTEEPIKQKWNGLAQHISTVVLGSTDMIVLTLLSTLENVSIYAVYNLVVNGVKQIVFSTTSGMQAMLGNMLAKNEIKELNKTFENFEWTMHTLVTFVFSSTAILIVPFIRVYTADITDANYIVPAFAYMLTLALAMYCLRLPYNIMVLAAGHYKQTQWSAIIEASINIIFSIVLVFKFGLIGVAIGTFAAMTYRTVYLANYLKNNIIYRKFHHFVKHLIVDGCSVIVLFVVVFFFSSFYVLEQLNYSAWVVLAIKVTMTCGTIMIFINTVFYRKNMKSFVDRSKQKI